MCASTLSRCVLLLSGHVSQVCKSVIRAVYIALSSIAPRLTLEMSTCLFGMYGFGMVRSVFLTDRTRDQMCTREMMPCGLVKFLRE